MRSLAAEFWLNSLKAYAYAYLLDFGYSAKLKQIWTANLTCWDNWDLCQILGQYFVIMGGAVCDLIWLCFESGPVIMTSYLSVFELEKICENQFLGSLYIHWD